MESYNIVLDILQDLTTHLNNFFIFGKKIKMWGQIKDSSLSEDITIWGEVRSSHGIRGKP